MWRFYPVACLKCVMNTMSSSRMVSQHRAQSPRGSRDTTYGVPAATDGEGFRFYPHHFARSSSNASARSSLSLHLVERHRVSSAYNTRKRCRTFSSRREKSVAPDQTLPPANAQESSPNMICRVWHTSRLCGSTMLSTSSSSRLSSPLLYVCTVVVVVVVVPREKAGKKLTAAPSRCALHRRCSGRRPA